MSPIRGAKRESQKVSDDARLSRTFRKHLVPICQEQLEVENGFVHYHRALVRLFPFSCHHDHRFGERWRQW